MTVKGIGGSGYCSTSITVFQPPRCTLTVEPESVMVGEEVTLNWTATLSDTATIDQEIGDVELPTGSLTLIPDGGQTIYTMEVVGSGGIETCTAEVEALYPQPSCTLLINPDYIELDQSASLEWKTANTVSAIIDQDIGEVDLPSGSMTVLPTEDTTYIMTASGRSAEVTCQASIGVHIPKIVDDDDDDEDGDDEEDGDDDDEDGDDEEDGDGVTNGTTDEATHDEPDRDIKKISIVNESWINNNRPEISGEAEPESTIEILINSEYVTAVLADSLGVFSYQPEEALADGTYLITLKTEQTEISLTLHIDTVPPPKPKYKEPRFVHRKAEDSELIETTLDFSGELTEEGFAELSYFSLYVFSDPQIIKFTPESRQWSYTVAVELTEGWHEVYLQAHDRAGNISAASDSKIFEVKVTECSDGLDNDNDGSIDYPEDTDCASPTGKSEGKETIVDALTETPRKVLEKTGEIIEKPLEVIGETTKEVVQDITQVATKVIDNPQVEKATKKYVAPVAVTVAAANTATALPFINILVYLRYLVCFFTEPFYFLSRRRRRGWGVVYNSLTKQPVDLAIIRLYKTETNRLVQTRVTDIHGRYHFIVPAGDYYIKVLKQGFRFPSLYLRDKKEDYAFHSIYHGNPFHISAEEGAVRRNIPLDPPEADTKKMRVPIKGILHKPQKLIAFLGPLIAFFSFLIAPSWLILGLLLVHIFLYLLFRRFGKKEKVEKLGTIVDSSTNKPIKHAVIRLFQAEFNKLIRSQIANKKGRYGFLAGQGIFYLTVSKKGYHNYRTEFIDLREKGKGDFIATDIKLRPVEGGQPTITGKPEDASPLLVTKAPAQPAEKKPDVEPEIKKPAAPPGPAIETEPKKPEIKNQPTATSKQEQDNKNKITD